MNDKRSVYVGNLPYDTTREELETLFGRCGKIFSIKLITDSQNNLPRGYGFVEMRSADAEYAVDYLNGKKFGGRQLKVNFSKMGEEMQRRQIEEMSRGRYDEGIIRRYDEYPQRGREYEGRRMEYDVDTRRMDYRRADYSRPQRDVRRDYTRPREERRDDGGRIREERSSSRTKNREDSKRNDTDYRRDESSTKREPEKGSRHTTRDEPYPSSDRRY